MVFGLWALGCFTAGMLIAILASWCVPPRKRGWVDAVVLALMITGLAFSAALLCLDGIAAWRADVEQVEQ